MPAPATSIIVSGYPRSGTTAMMRMLHYGGIPVIADAEVSDVPMDEFTPYGIYELDYVGTQIAEHEPTWTAGKAIKVVAPYLHWLSMVDRPMKVIFMLRDETEIISSLLAMRTIWRHGPSETVQAARERLERYSVPTHYVHYRDMFKYPRATAIGLQDFLGAEFPLDLAKAASAIDRKVRTRVKGIAYPDGHEPLLLFGGKVLPDELFKEAR